MANIPDIDKELLMAALTRPSVNKTLQSGMTGLGQGLDLASTLQKQKLDRQKQEMDLMKEIAALQEKETNKLPLEMTIPTTKSTATVMGEEVPVKPYESQQKETRMVSPETYTAFQKPLLEKEKLDSKSSGIKPYEYSDPVTGKVKIGKIDGQGNLITSPNDPESGKTSYAKVRMAGQIKEAQTSLAKSLNPQTYTVGTPEGRDAIRVQSANVIKDTAKTMRGGKAQPQRLIELARETDRMLVGSGQTSEGITHQLIPNTAQFRFANLEQFVTSNPAQFNAEQWLDLFEKMADTVKQGSLDRLQQNLELKSANSVWLKDNSPELYNKTVENATKAFSKYAGKQPIEKSGLNIDMDAVTAELARRGIK
jgi:hypothetical protein